MTDGQSPDGPRQWVGHFPLRNRLLGAFRHPELHPRPAGTRLVQQPGEILQDLAINVNNQYATGSPPPALQPESGPSPLDNKYEMLLDAAGFEPVDIDVLAFRTSWSGHTGASMLLLLELQGRIAPQPGGWYCRLS
jgi:DNA processing protein